MTRSLVVVAAGSLLAVTASLWLLPLPAAWFGAAIAVTCAIIAAVDLDRFIIPDTANLTLVGLGLAETWIASADGQRLAALADAGLRCVAAGGVLYLTAQLYRWASGRDGLGMGDVKLGAAAGACLDWATLPMVLELSVLLAILVLVAVALVTRQWPDRHAPIPFGVYLAPAIWLGFMLEKTLISV